MVMKIIEEHHARITLGNRTDLKGDVLGAQIVIVFPCLEPKIEDPSSVVQNS